MSKNIILRAKTLQDIDARIERIISDLGNPEPPIDLREVRELLKLDLAYYTADDPNILEKAISRLRVGGIQIFKRPSLLKDIIKKFDLRAFYVPDKKRILIDKTQPLLKHRWLEAHEINHDLLPWHAGIMHGDSELTVSPQCHDIMETEANFGAGRLLFLRDRFTIQAKDHTPSIAAVKTLKPIFGNTYSTTFWRCVENWGAEAPIVGLITKHPHISRRAPDFDPAKPCRHFIQSPAFASRFSGVAERDVFEIIAGYCSSSKGGPLGEVEYVLKDDNGDRHLFHFESFSLVHDVLSLGTYLRPYTGVMSL